tara:strand:+ start:3063 stop:5216 length:2154 start_codon:yes stop_codon:yes gene_type:complete
MTQRIVISESQYNRLFLLGQIGKNNLLFEQGGEPFDYSKYFRSKRQEMSDGTFYYGGVGLKEWNNMSKTEKMRFIFPDLYNHGWGDEGYWSTEFEFFTPDLQKIIMYGQDLYYGENHNPNSKDGKEFELFVRGISTPEEWMKAYPKTMGKIFDPKNDKEKFKEIKKKWGDATPEDIEMFMYDSSSPIEDFDNFKGDMGVESKKDREDYDYWDEYYADINKKSAEEEAVRRAEWEKERDEYAELRKEWDQPTWKRLGYKSADDYYDYIQGAGDYSWNSIVNDLPAPARWLTKGVAGILYLEFKAAYAIEKVYNAFECSEFTGITYFHCIMGNTSIAVSMVPYLGTIGSAIIDAVDAIVYLGEVVVHSAKGNYYLLTGEWDKYQEESKEAAIKLGFGALSALGIIPGVTEAKLIFKAGPEVLKSTDNIVKELSEKGVKNLEPDEFEEIITRNTKDLTEAEKKSVGDVMEELTNPRVKEELINIEKVVNNFSKLSDEFMKKNKLTKKIFTGFIASKPFKKLMTKHGGDFTKAIKDKAVKDMLTTFLIQAGLSSLIVGGGTAYETYEYEKLKKDADKGIISAMVQLEGYDWPATRDNVFKSDKSQHDNELLKRAWLKGWRPWPKGEKPTKENVMETGVKWLLERPGYQTEKFKGDIRKSFVDVDMAVAPENEADRKEGVIYYPNQESLDLAKKAKDREGGHVTDEEFDKALKTMSYFKPAK